MAVSASLTGLAANTTYHFRISATNAGGTSKGADETLTTPPNAPTVVTGVATSITQTSATLNATVNPNGGEVTECKFEYGTNTEYKSTPVSCASLPGKGTKAVAVSASLAGLLTANTTYHFRISATNASGTSKGADETVTTLPVGGGGSTILTGSIGPPTLPTTASPPIVTSTTSATFTATVNPGGLATSAHFEYGPVLGGGTGPITYESVTPDQSVGSDFANHTVTATVTELLPNVTYHFRVVATNSAGSLLGADQTFNTPADPPPPPPVFGKSVDVTVVSGIVYVKLPPGATLASRRPPARASAALTKGLGFVPLTEARQIPVGSTLDTTAGVARITTATSPSSKGKLQSGDFGAGLFKLLQNRRQRGLTELNMLDVHSRQQVCVTAGKARIAAAHLSRKVLGRLNANSHGKFTARGQYSASTVRGTIWTVENRCDGTLTRVTRGVVQVRDFRLRKTVTLFTGMSYLAKAP